jgi:hypothetical protein
MKNSNIPQTKTVQHFFHQKKVHQPIGRKDYIHAVCRRMKRLEAFLYLAAQNFKLFSKILDQNKKLKKLIVFDVFSEAYSWIPRSCRSNLAGRYL